MCCRVDTQLIETIAEQGLVSSACKMPIEIPSAIIKVCY